MMEWGALCAEMDLLVARGECQDATRTLNRAGALAAAVPVLLAEREEMLAVLREVEWGGGGMRCPSCGSTEVEAARAMEKYGQRPVFGLHGHAPDCRLAALLR